MVLNKKHSFLVKITYSRALHVQKENKKCLKENKDESSTRFMKDDILS